MTATPGDCVHLTVDIVKEIHGAVIAAFGGLHGVRDEGLLASAVAAPQATFGGESPFADVVEVAAAIVFLRLNAIEPAPDSEDWEALVLDVAASRIDREQTTARLRRLVPLPRKRARRKKK